MSRRARVAARWSLCLLALGAFLVAGLPARPAGAAATLTLCVAHPPEVPPGVPFTFTVTNTTIGAGNDVFVPGGQCRIFDDLAGDAAFTIREQIPPGFRLTGIAVDGADLRSVSTNLAQATVAFTIPDGAAARITFANTATGTLRICKEAGPDLDPTAEFRFTIVNGATRRSNTTIAIPAGQCIFIDSQSLAMAVGPGLGPYTVQEIAPAGIDLTDVIVSGPGVDGVATDVARASATFTLDPSGAATLVFTSAPPRAAAVSCADFATPADAQAFLDADPSDPFGIDPDGDFIACNHPMMATPPAPMTGATNSVRPISRTVCPPAHPIKGNRTSMGELIYHVPGGASYAQTEAEECFATEEDAIRAGYRRSLR